MPGSQGRNGKAKRPRGTRPRLRPMEQGLKRNFSFLRPQPHSRSPRSLGKARGFAEQAQSIERKRFKEPTGPLLWAREAGPRAKNHRRVGFGFEIGRAHV